MTRRALLAASALVIAPCSASTDAGKRLASSLAVDYADIPLDTTILVQGSAIVGAATVVASCGAQHRLDAGVRNGVVRLAVTDSVRSPVPCMLIPSYARYVATAQPAPRGPFEVELVLREVVGAQVTTTTLKRKAFTLP